MDRLASLRARALLISWAAVCAGLTTRHACAADLEDRLGRNETRVYSAPVPLVSGMAISAAGLDERLDRLGYRRIHTRPETPGEYFHGRDVYWFYRKACHEGGTDHPPERIGLELDPRSSRIVGLRRDGASAGRLDKEGEVWIEPELLSESLTANRADRIRIRLDRLPERVWRPVLAAEDARFFEHAGVDPRAVARAAFRNIRKGKVAEGGSTITQQLVKNRDLSPERSMARKASEAVRALSLESDYDKREILEAYLNQVYMGHVEGLAIHGLGTAARAYFSKRAEDLTLTEAAALAAMIQGPNRLSPLEDPKALRERRDWVLRRMEELGWAAPVEVERARRAAVNPAPSRPRCSAPAHFLSWVSMVLRAEERDHAEAGRGFLVETTLDPLLQGRAERAIADHLDRLRRENPRLRRDRLSAALVALDARSGEVLAYVGGDPGASTAGIDRVRSARRQPGSAVKPFVVLEALEDCGGRDPLTASSRVSDAPLSLALPSGIWEPRNFDGTYRGAVTVREALEQSRNVPTVRIARHCSLRATAEEFRSAGIQLPPDPPPSFVLGSVETTPLELAQAYTVLATPGKRLEATPLRRAETPSGRGLVRFGTESRRAADPAAAYIVRALLTGAVLEGTARSGRIEGVDLAAKTGSSSGLRDAWFAGQAGSIVAVVWVGLDDGEPLGLTGGEAAGPAWRRFMETAIAARPPYEVPRPAAIVERWVELQTGLLVRDGARGARPEIYRRGAIPPRKRFWRIDRPLPVIE